MQLWSEEGMLKITVYALRTEKLLRAHVLPSEALQEVSRGTSVARLLYAAPTWWGITWVGEAPVFPGDVPSMRKSAAGADGGLLRALLQSEEPFPPLATTY